MLIGLSCVFPSNDIVETANYYENKMGFIQVKYLNSKESHICLYRDSTEIILVQALNKNYIPNHKLYGYGYDAYFYTRNQIALQEEFRSKKVKIVKEFSITDYNNEEFVVEDIGGRWIGFGLKV